LLGKKGGKPPQAKAGTSAAGGQRKGKQSVRPFQLKTPKGTKDYTPEQTKIRENMFETLRTVFRKHGAVAIETPVFELKDTLTGKYGEDSKLIYDLAEQGGEICSLRYDLTVPFARYVAQHGIDNIKRYQIGRVYRRDQPRMENGRYREFYQCDFDIAGKYSEMIPDAEILAIMCETLSALELGSPFVIKLNHRMLLDGIFEVCGVPADNFRPICSAVDKLDKLSWEEVKQEMVETKGLKPEVADRIGKYVKFVGKPLELLPVLLKERELTANKHANEALRLLGVLFKYLEAYGVLEHLSFDLSLARGLDYYTGVIFEAILPDAQVGSVSAGGRYDNLINMFAKNKGRPIPAVGFSVGVERIFTLLEANAQTKGPSEARASDTLVLVATSYGATLFDRMRILRELWQGGIPAETISHPKPNMKKQLDYAEQHKIPLCVLIGEDEMKAGVISIKDMYAPRDSERKQFTVPRAELVDTLLKYKTNLQSGKTHEEAMLDLA